MTNPHPPKDRRLGKGLAALLGTPLDEEAQGDEVAAEPRRQPPKPRAADPPAQSADAADAGSQTAPPEKVTAEAGPLYLPVDQIDPNPFQPRRDFSPEEIASLAESLKRHEQLQPVLVRRIGERYQLISGERRLRATIHAGRSQVRAEIRAADDRLVAELAIVENMERKDLNPVEKAMSFKRYIDQHQCKQEALAGRLGLDRSTVANLMRLLELPQQILDWIVSGELTAGHARALLPIGDEDEQLRLARQIQEEGWSVRKTESEISELLRSEEEAENPSVPLSPHGRKRTVTPHVESLQTELRHQLGTKVEIRQTAKGKGKITIHFTSAEEFDRLRGILANQSAPPLKLAG